MSQARTSCNVPGNVSQKVEIFSVHPETLVSEWKLFNFICHSRQIDLDKNVKLIITLQGFSAGLKTLHFPPIFPITNRLLTTYRAGVFHNVTLHEKKC